MGAAAPPQRRAGRTRASLQPPGALHRARLTLSSLPPPPPVAAFAGAGLCITGQPVVFGGRRGHDADTGGIPTLHPRHKAEEDARLNCMPREGRPDAPVQMNPIRRGAY